ncbi:hypothetical protein P170DRAFT_476602 [Aspergillus steynii IBT 23096]|uniref:S-adenosyl-L-methionine-dependent methyltransferase n=1 Tax=Aspergillus steynii IBT 23096 TaxID=1392250 RepID=A0A2I2G4Z2_9EURO|nr:uncharacterized protein P170DRAFT_476602 [Aspergillus steynii IBT 23096]PLB47949.1 hypothetical protein P170DRAFT_476602 [Aspergillus steynii IBT 23096]
MTSPDSQTEELDDIYLETVTIHRREYQKYSVEHQISFQPVDEDEAERLDLQHRIFNRVFDNRLIFPPIPQPRQILDCGYGTGSWAIEIAEQHPDCDVIGLDIFPHNNSDDIPDNLWLQVSWILFHKFILGVTATSVPNERTFWLLAHFAVDDLNRPFTFPSNHFDLVQSRMLATGINKDRVLKPGGWVQLIEIYFNVQSDNGSITERNALRQWSSQLMGSLEETKDLRVGTRLRTLLAAEGLQEVDARMIPLPLCAWSNDPRMQGIGEMNRGNIQKLLSTMALYPFTQKLNMPLDQFEDLIGRARQEADTAGLKAYFPLYVCIGRKAR